MRWTGCNNRLLHGVGRTPCRLGALVFWVLCRSEYGSGAELMGGHTAWSRTIELGKSMVPLYDSFHRFYE